MTINRRLLDDFDASPLLLTRNFLGSVLAFTKFPFDMKWMLGFNRIFKLALIPGGVHDLE